MRQDFIIWEEAHHAGEAWWKRFWRDRLGPALQSYQERHQFGQAYRQHRHWLVVGQAIEANIRRAAPPEQLPQFTAQLQKENMRKAGKE